MRSYDWLRNDLDFITLLEDMFLILTGILSFKMIQMPPSFCGRQKGKIFPTHSWGNPISALLIKGMVVFTI